jgi:hypothetical protein
MPQAPDLLASSEPEDQSTDEYDAIVIATMNDPAIETEPRVALVG